MHCWYKIRTGRIDALGDEEAHFGGGEGSDGVGRAYFEAEVSLMQASV